jgi:hypothetical protein
VLKQTSESLEFQNFSYNTNKEWNKNQNNVPEYEVVIHETVKNWYKNVNQDSGTVVTADWPAIWSTVTYHNHVWRTQIWYQIGWSQDAEIPDDETLLYMPTMWIHWEGNTAATDGDLKTNTFSSLIVHSSSLLSLSHALFYFLLVFVVVTKFRCSITATNIAEKHEGRIKVFYLPTDAHVTVLKAILKFTLK